MLLFENKSSRFTTNSIHIYRILLVVRDQLPARNYGRRAGFNACAPRCPPGRCKEIPRRPPQDFRGKFPGNFQKKYLPKSQRDPQNSAAPRRENSRPASSKSRRGNPPGFVFQDEISWNAKTEKPFCEKGLSGSQRRFRIPPRRSANRRPASSRGGIPKASGRCIPPAPTLESTH